MSEALAIARSLIRCPSVTPDDAGALAVLARLLDERGFAVHPVTFEAPNTPTIANLYARRGSGPPFLLFAGHTDVVPPGPSAAWRHDPFAAAVDDGVLHGRGTQDMKGGIAAFVAAVFAFLDRQPGFTGSIGFLITGDEEGPAINGTTKLLDWARTRGECFDHCIVGEPTSRVRLGDTIKVGRRGSLNGTVMVDGRQGHVAYPAKAANPIPVLLRVLDALLMPLDDGSALFAPSNLEITSIDVGNSATNVIPARATAAFNVRFNDHWTPQSLRDALQKRVRPIGDGIALIFAPCNAEAFHTPSSPFTDLVIEAVTAVTGARPDLSTTGGTSDARFVKDHCPVLEIGLVGDTMHMVDERVPVADLEQLAALYGAILDRYFAAG